MKQSKLAYLLLPVLLVGLVFLVPFKMATNKANENRAKAESMKSEVATAESQVALAKDVMAREAQLKSELGKIRAVLPNVPDQYITPVINSLSALGAKYPSVVIKDQTQASPIAAAAVPNAAPAGSSAAAPEPKAFTISLRLSGKLDDVVRFTNDVRGTQRLFVQNFTVTPGPGTEGGFSNDRNDMVEASLTVKAYIAGDATAAMPKS